MHFHWSCLSLTATVQVAQICIDLQMFFISWFFKSIASCTGLLLFFLFLFPGFFSVVLAVSCRNSIDSGESGEKKKKIGHCKLLSSTYYHFGLMLCTALFLSLFAHSKTARYVTPPSRNQIFFVLGLLRHSKGIGNLLSYASGFSRMPCSPKFTD